MTAPNDFFAATMAAAGFVPPELPEGLPNPEALDAADRHSRYWTSHHEGELRVGSASHLHETCRMFRETFNPCRPAVIRWPKLSPEMLQRLTSLPIWNIAVHTEGRARLRFASYAATLKTSEGRDAVMLNAREENRHKEVLANLVKAYGIALGPEPDYRVPRDPEWMYLVTGYSECIDSFFAFGLFELACRSGFFPAELVETFEPVMQEDVATSCCLPAWWPGNGRPYRGGDASPSSAASRQLGSPSPGNGWSWRAQAVTPVEIGVRDLMALCLQENDRRFAVYDARLVRPRTVPTLARTFLFLTKPWARKNAGDTEPLERQSDERSPAGG